MRKGVFSVLGGTALAALLPAGSGCLQTYDAAAPVTTQPGTTETGPEQSAAQTSAAPTAVQPLTPSSEAVAWTENGDPSLIAAQQQQQGPIDISSRQHACMKVHVDTLGRILAGIGVNMTISNVTPAPANAAPLVPLPATIDCTQLIPGMVSKTATSGSFTPPGGTPIQVVPLSNSTNAFDLAALVAQPARYVYCAGALALGLPQYSGRLAESNVLTTASITKQFDVFLAAASEIAANATLNSPRCLDPDTGKPAVLFNADNTCNEAGITCLQGYPATAEQVSLCSRVASQGTATPAAPSVPIRFLSTVAEANGGAQPETYVRVDSTSTMSVPGVPALTVGKEIAVAALLSGAHACE